MSYIGNTPFTAAFLTDTFSGNGSTVAFTMTVAPASTSSVIVAITGVLQDPSTYSVSGTTLTFSAAPPTGTSNISVRYLGIPASGVATTAYRTVTNTTATAGQTSFSIPSYTVGYVDVYRNGVYLPTTDYTATTGTTVVLNNAATVGDTITTVSFYVSSVLNAIPATAGSVSSTYLVDASVTQAKLGTNVAGTGPAFSAYIAANQSATGSAQIITFNTEVYDSNNCFNNTGSTVTLNGVSVPAYSFGPNVAGYYQINCSLSAFDTVSGSAYLLQIYKNGSIFLTGAALPLSSGTSTMGGSASQVIYMNGTSDTVQIYGRFAGTLPVFFGSATGSNFSAALVRAA